VLLVGSTIEGGGHGFAATGVLVGYAAALACGGLFVWLEARGRSPMLPLSLFRSRVFSVCSIAGLLVNTAFYGLIFVISLFFQRVQGLSPLMTGLALAPVMIGITAANIASGRMQERLGATRVLALGAVVLAAACAGMLSVGAGTGYGAIVVQLAALGVGGGLVVPTVTAQLLGSVDRSRSGVAGGTLNTLRQTGSAVGVALFGSLLAGSAGFVAGVHASFAIAIGLGLAIAALAPLLRPRR
jgi:DHA2 family methylenomycin A resistance protein-like MFS transporter